MKTETPAQGAEPRLWVSVLGFTALFGVVYHYPYLPLQMPRQMTPIWPATSVALAGLLVGGRRAWPWLLGLTSAFALLYQAFVVAVPWSVNLGVVAINNLQVLATAWLVRRWTGPRLALDRLRDVGVLLVAVAAVNTVAAGLALSIMPQYLGLDPLVHLRVRFISHTLAAWILTSAVITLQMAAPRIRNLNWARWAEAAACALGGHLLMRFAVGGMRFDTALPPAPYLAIVPVVIAAIRFGPPGAALMTVLVGLNVADAIGHGRGWPPGADYYTRLSHAQLLLAVTAVTGLLLAASGAEKAALARGWREGEERFRLLFEHAVDAICTVKRDRLALMNPACGRLFGLAPGAVPEECRLRDRVHPDDRAAVDDLCARLESDAAGPDRLEVRGVRTDGSAFPMHLQATKFTHAGERQLLLRLRDLGDERRAEREMRRINRVLHTISGIHRVLVRATSASQLLHEICRTVATSEGFRMAWVGFVEHGEQKRVRPVAWAGFEDGYLEKTPITWANTPHGRGPAGRAVRSGQPVSCRNVATDPDYEPWREEARKRGYNSSIALPLKDRGQVVAVLSFYSAEVEAFDSPEIVLLQEMAESLLFGLNALHAREKQERAEKEVRRLLAEAEAGRLALLSILEDRKLADEARERSEASLEAAAERLALALRASKFGVWRHNLQTRASEWDARMFAIWGLPPASVAPSLDEILARVVDEDRAEVERSWRALPTCNHDYHLRFRVVGPDRTVRHVELHGIVHDDAFGRPEWSIGVAGDVTDIVRATSESERLRAQLQQAQKMEALGNLAAGVAHDFNNLLTGINGFVELASTSLAPGHEAAELLKQARKGAISARDLVRRILNFSRARAEKTRTALDVADVVRDTAPLIAAALPANVSLSVAINAPAAPVLADGAQLQQILMNLCTNGAHAIGTKAGRIQIHVQRCELGVGERTRLPPGCAAGRYVELAVSDTGCGMDEATRQRIFEPFFTTKKEGEGTGLGLSIVRDIVAAHEGGLEVESTPGVGTTFTIFLPAARPEPEALPAATARALAAGSGQRILVVDDEPTIAMVVRLSLQRTGFAPEAYSSPTDAWNRFVSDPRSFDLVIVDQNMPEITGPELIARLRGIAPDLPVVIMSGRFENVDGLDPQRAGRVTALKKPFEIVDLVAAVRAALQPAAPAKGAAAAHSPFGG